MYFDFAWFREQTCIVACPYGRLQSVLLDSNSLIVSYDPLRGEPRGRGRNVQVKPAAMPQATADNANKKGDCIDCSMCVDTCPTGIDIRDGLRMECIGCAQCIDACDAVMTKLKRPLGLVRYSSQQRIVGGRGAIARPRLFIYAAVLVAIGGVFVTLVSQAKDTDVTLLRGMGMPFTELPDGEIGNTARLKLTNRTHEPHAYRIEVVEGGPARILMDDPTVTARPTQAVTRGLIIAVPATSFNHGLRIVNEKNAATETTYELLGPYGRTPASKDTRGHASR
jgi:cytochrome c oxidase accessory protein FixG